MQKTMHIMHVIDSLAVGGAERMLTDIANQTALDGHQVSVCITRDGCDMASELNPRVRCYVLGRSRRFDWAAMRRFSTLLRDEHVDILHSHGRSTYAFLAFAKTLGLIRRPIILHDHFGGIERDSSIPIWFKLWAKHLITHYVGVYSRLGMWAKACGIPDERVSVIENALDLSRIEKATPLNLRKEFSIRDDAPIGILVGGLDRDKGIDLLLEALGQLSRSSVGRILIIGGDRDPSYARACRSQNRSLGLNGKVIFIGERSDLPGLIRGADFALVPSRSESGPLVLIEYLAGGLPFVSTLVGAIAHMLAELGIKEFVLPNDPPSFAKALDTLLNLSPSQRKQRGKIGKKIALRYLDIQRTMPQWYQVYAKAMKALRN